jgi:hypothetical protein
MSCHQAAEYVLQSLPNGVTVAIEEYRTHSGRTLTVQALARMLADASEGSASKPGDAKAARKSVDVLDGAWETAERALRSAGKSISKTYSAYDLALAAVLAKTVPAEVAAMGILQVALAEIQG